MLERNRRLLPENQWHALNQMSMNAGVSVDLFMQLWDEPERLAPLIAARFAGQPNGREEIRRQQGSLDMVQDNLRFVAFDQLSASDKEQVRLNLALRGVQLDVDSPGGLSD